ncbi:hypothetical protein [Amycolatopsis sulphurea]|uniref:hypothetical protein n=1 Tax=Amycolatopsis sulphurea TaxID=76022 RepID=UPI001145CDDF
MRQTPSTVEFTGGRDDGERGQARQEDSHEGDGNETPGAHGIPRAPGTQARVPAKVVEDP